MITFKQFITEAKEGDRVGIQHLYSQNKPELYSMSLHDFKRFINYLQQNKGMITPENSTVTEKVDGMALKVGNDENGFFVRSSYSGKVYNPEDFMSVIKYPPAREAFINSFERIKHLISPIIGKHNVTVQLEWLYSPNALEADPNSGKVSFVVAQYNKDRLGAWSTFIVINVHGDDSVNTGSIIKKLIAINDKEVKFILPNVNIFHSIDLRSEVVNAQKALGSLAKVEQELAELKEQIAVGGPGRNKLVQRRKELEAKVHDKLLPIQKQMYTKIAGNLLKTEGLLGDIEGYVIKAGDLTFKVNSPHFMSSKFGAQEKEDDEEFEGASSANAFLGDDDYSGYPNSVTNNRTIYVGAPYGVGGGEAGAEKFGY
jgi:hypothetical protein